MLITTAALSVDPPVVPSDVRLLAFAAARQQALSDTPDAYRDHLLIGCAQLVEQWAQRVLFAGPGGAARRSVSEIGVRFTEFDGLEPVSLCLMLPRASGVTMALVGADRWEAGAWEHLGADRYRLLPGGRIDLSLAARLPAADEADDRFWRISSDVLPVGGVDPSAAEALARLWAYRSTLRPGDLTDVGGEQQPLAGGMLKSGAAEALRPLIHRWELG